MKRYIINFTILSAFVLIALFGVTQKADAAISLTFGGGSYSSTGYGYGDPYYNNGYYDSSASGLAVGVGLNSPNYYNSGYGNYGNNYGYNTPLINCYVYGYPCNNNYYNNNNYSYNNYNAVSPYYYAGGTNYVDPYYNNYNTSYNNYNTAYTNPNIYGGYYSSPTTMYGPRSGTSCRSRSC